MSDKGMILKPKGMELMAFADTDFSGDWCKEYSEDLVTAYSRSRFVVLLADAKLYGKARCRQKWPSA